MPCFVDGGHIVAFGSRRVNRIGSVGRYAVLHQRRRKRKRNHHAFFLGIRKSGYTFQKTVAIPNAYIVFIGDGLRHKVKAGGELLFFCVKRAAAAPVIGFRDR